VNKVTSLQELATFEVLTRLRFGPGAIAEVGEIVRRLGVNKTLVVTDAGVVKAGIVGHVTGALSKAGVDSIVFDDVEPNPSMQTADKAVTRYREEGCDGIVAVGGGSPIDAAKGTGVLATNPGSLSDYVGRDKVHSRLPPLVAVPTTVGTGSEVTMWAVITDRANHCKEGIGSPLMAPRFAVLDPVVVRSLPTALVASTAMDALTHAIESLCSNCATVFSEVLAVAAIRMIAASLPLAVRSEEIEPRAELLYASTIAGMAFGNSRTGLVHGMAHPVSAYYDVPHGVANAVLLPYVLAFNAPVCESLVARIAEAMGREADAQTALDAVRGLSAAVGIPQHLSDVGVTDTYIPQMAQDAFQSGNAQISNPRKPSLAEVIELYHQAL
jgi:alcohol dehydrogenase class IV